MQYKIEANTKFKVPEPYFRASSQIQVMFLFPVSIQLKMWDDTNSSTTGMTKKAKNTQLCLGENPKKLKIGLKFPEYWPWRLGELKWEFGLLICLHSNLSAGTMGNSSRRARRGLLDSTRSTTPSFYYLVSLYSVKSTSIHTKRKHPSSNRILAFKQLTWYARTSTPKSTIPTKTR